MASIKLSKNMEEKLEKLREKMIIEQEEREQYIKNKEYIKFLNDELTKSISTEDNEWTEAHDDFFDVMTNSFMELATLPQNYEGEIFIRCGTQLIMFFEMHGQGCYRRIEIEPINDTTVINEGLTINIIDLDKYIQTGEKPKKYEVLEVACLALQAMETFSQKFNIDVNIEEMQDYLINNLK